MTHHASSDDFSAARSRASTRSLLATVALGAAVGATLWLVPDWPRWKFWLLLLLALAIVAARIFLHRCPRCHVALPSPVPTRCLRCGAILYHKILV